MSKRMETREIKASQEVEVTVCDSCGKDEVAYVLSIVPDRPPMGWLRVTSVGKTPLDFCSWDCVAQFAPQVSA